MFTHSAMLQNEVKPDQPDALLAAKIQELVGGQFGEMTVMMQYLWQGWNGRIPGKYKDIVFAKGAPLADDDGSLPAPDPLLFGGKAGANEHHRTDREDHP